MYNADGFKSVQKTQIQQALDNMKNNPSGDNKPAAQQPSAQQPEQQAPVAPTSLKTEQVSSVLASARLR